MNRKAFKALGDPTRLHIVEFLSHVCCNRVAVHEDGGVEGPTAGEICCHITGAEKITSTVSQHLHELEGCGLIQIERRGKAMVCTLRTERLRALGSYLIGLTDGPMMPEGVEPMSQDPKLIDRNDVREVVREKYGAAALTVLQGQGKACCGGIGKKGESCCGDDVITGNLYSDTEAADIPEDALLASLGCGNPTALAGLNPGEVVLDLGSGGGIDVLLSARRVGPEGFAYGLDMTDEMLALAEKNKAEAGATNVKFLKGHIESIPLPDDSVDVIISNCVINLSGDKDAVLREAFRVLRPGGRFAVSDVVVDGYLPDAVRADMTAYVGCVAGALDRQEYLNKLAAAGFVEGSIEPTRHYTFADLEATTCSSPEVAALSPEEKQELDGRVMGAFIRAQKPA